MGRGGGQAEEGASKGDRDGDLERVRVRVRCREGWWLHRVMLQDVEFRGFGIVVSSISSPIWIEESSVGRGVFLCSSSLILFSAMAAW